MITLSQFFQDLTNPALAFLPKALLVAVLSAVVCGVVGAHVVLRGMAFIGDAVAHAVFPGLAIAFALQASVVLGGAVAGIVVAVLIAVFSQRRRIKEDTIIGIFFAAAFAAGLVVISKVQGYTASLTSFLFGSITGVATEDIVLVAVVGTVVIALLLVFHKELVAVSLDRETAAAQNIRVFAFDLLLYLAVTAAVVMSVRTVGNILVLALLVTPAATARLLTDRLPIMMALSAVIGAVASVLGVYLSWAFDVPTGAMIVLVVTALFLIAFCGSALRSSIPTPPRSSRTRSTVARKKVAAGVASVLVLVGAGIIGPVLPGSGDSGLESNSGALSFAAVANAAEDATDGAATGEASQDGTHEAADNSADNNSESTETKSDDESGDGAGDELTDEDEDAIEALMRVFKKLNVDVLRLADSLPQVVKNIMNLAETLRGEKSSQPEKREGKEREDERESDREQTERSKRVADAIIDRTKNPADHTGRNSADGRAENSPEDGDNKRQGNNDSTASGKSGSRTGGGNTSGTGNAGGAGNTGGGGSASVGEGDQPDTGSTGGSSGVGGDVDTSDDAADDSIGEEGVEDADDELEQAAEDVLGEDGVEGEDNGGGVKALGYSGGANGDDSQGENGAKQPAKQETKLQQLASSLMAGGFGGGFTMGVGLMALLGGGLFFLMAARNMRDMKMAMLQAELQAEIDAELREERRAEEREEWDEEYATDRDLEASQHRV